MTDLCLSGLQELHRAGMGKALGTDVGKAGGSVNASLTA